MGSPETSREPCPDRIVDDIGGAFAMGATGGSIYHFLKGAYNSPKGERVGHGIQTVRMNAPRTGGGFGVWGGLFSTFDCSMVYIRQKEDPWNSIIAGAATGGLLQMRQGLGPASKSALMGGIFLAMIEGAGIMLNKFISSQQMPPMEEGMPNMAGIPGLPQMSGKAPYMEEIAQQASSSSSWFGGLFGGEKKQEETKSESQTEVLESFDAPSPPTFEFK